jgi:hypothetical protein
MYKKGDIVVVRSAAGPAIPNVRVKLLEKIVVKKRKGNYMDWPGYVGWECEMVDKNEVDKLRKRFRIPFQFPNNIETFVYEEDIIS